MVEKLYADRDPAQLEPWYSKHVNAMTAEGLHSKAETEADPTSGSPRRVSGS